HVDQIVECCEGGLSGGPAYECLVGSFRHHGDDEAQLLRGISAEIDRLPKRDVPPRIPFPPQAPPRERGLSVQRTRQDVYRATVTRRLLRFVIAMGVGARVIVCLSPIERSASR